MMENFSPSTEDPPRSSMNRQERRADERRRRKAYRDAPRWAKKRIDDAGKLRDAEVLKDQHLLSTKTEV